MTACSDRCGHCGRCTDRSGDESSNVKYRCLDCAWTGRDGVRAFWHHRQDHHRISTGFGLAVFACCKDRAA